MSLKNRRHRQIVLMMSILVCAPHLLWGQTAAAPQEQESPSLKAPLKRASEGKTELHILYVHGMGIETAKHSHGEQDFEVSQEFRTNFCQVIRCLTKAGEPKGGEFLGRHYADQAAFNFKEGPPPLLYPGDQLLYPGGYLWKPSPANEEWHAAAPFVDHYKLVRKNGTPIYVDEINWWPLILSAKCRRIVDAEVPLIDIDKKHFATCAANSVKDKDPDPNHQGRFKSFAWITDNPKHDAKWPEPAVINRALKHDILDWGFADALLAVGPMHRYLIEGIREVVLESLKEAEDSQQKHPEQTPEFVVVSHSLGSYLMFSGLDLRDDDPNAKNHPEWITDFEKLLGMTSRAYFMANQVRLLELANLDDTKNGDLIKHLRTWADARQAAHQPTPQIIAWSDPDDLLTWKVPDLGHDVPGSNGNYVTVDNRPSQNAWRWFWLLESPEGAHTKYDKNKHVLREMIQAENGTKPAPPSR
jgi:hypothetical protein